MIVFDAAAKVNLKMFKVTPEEVAIMYSSPEGKGLYEIHRQKKVSTDDAVPYMKEAESVTSQPNIFMLASAGLFLLAVIPTLIFPESFFLPVFKVVVATMIAVCVVGLAWMGNGWYGYYRMKRFKKKADKQGKSITFKTRWISKPSDFWSVIGVLAFFGVMNIY